MGSLISLTLTLAIASGQLIKIPVGTHGGVTLIDIALAFFCLLGLYQLKFRLKKPPPFIKAGLFFISIATLSLLLAPLHLSQLEYLTSFFYTVRFAIYILFGWILYSGGFPLLSQKITQVLTFSGLILAVGGILQFIFLPNLWFLESSGWDPHVLRAVSTFLDPNFLGGYLTLTLILISQVLLGKKLNILFFTIIYIALMLTFSRSAYLMFFVSFTTFALLKKSVRLGLLTILLTAGLILAYQTYLQLIAAPRNIDRVGSAKFRVDSWEHGYKLFMRSPLIGIGHNSYRYALKQYNLAPEQFIQSRGASANDSSLLQVASTTGIFGFIAYIFFLGALITQAWSAHLSKNPWGAILVSALVGLILHSTFANSLFYPPILIWLLLVATKR